MPEKLPDVDALSCSSGDVGEVYQPPAPVLETIAQQEGALPPIAELSDHSTDFEDDCKELGLKSKKKKKRKQRFTKPLKERMISETDCKVMLQRRCEICKRCCMSPWLKKEKFQALMSFRKVWASLHKLDQDKFVPCLHLLWSMPPACLVSFLFMGLPIS